MILASRNDLFTLAPSVDAVVNPVNCVGPWGKGIALGCKQRWPLAYRAWRTWLKTHTMHPGQLWPFGPMDSAPYWLLNVATKDHWRNPSTLPWVVLGAVAIRVWLEHHPHIHTVVVPAMGCGNGGLDWCDVRPELCRIFTNLPQTIYLIDPA